MNFERHILFCIMMDKSLISYHTEYYVTFFIDYVRDVQYSLTFPAYIRETNIMVARIIPYKL